MTHFKAQAVGAVILAPVVIAVCSDSTLFAVLGVAYLAALYHVATHTAKGRKAARRIYRALLSGQPWQN